MIRIENLMLQMKGRTIFDGLNLTVQKGEVVGIIGPSGTGKSVLLRCLMLLQKPTSGHIFLDDTEITAKGADLDAVHRRIGMVFQNFNLFSHMTVLENVMAGLVDLRGVSPMEAMEQAMEQLRRVGMADMAFFYPAKLSGGQQQRAAIARTLAMQPDIILLDEPTSALDPMMRGEVEAVIRNMAAQGHTMLIVSHEMELIRQVCSRVLFLAEGNIYEEGTPRDIFEQPARDQTRRFVRALRVVEFEVHSRDFDFIGAQSRLTEFAFCNGMNRKLQGKMESVMEELFDMVIIQPKEQNRMHISFEYNRNEESLSGVIRFSGPPVDPDDPMYFFSWPIITMRAKQVEVESIQEEGYTNRVSLLLQ